jgi:parallel beta-helix repeat protein
VGVLGDYAGIYLLNSPDCEVIGNEIEGDYYGIQSSTSEWCLVANNMVYFASLSGIHDSEGSNNHYYFNSVYQGTHPTTTYNLCLNNNTNSDVKNNILYQNGTGTDYAISIAGDLSTYPVTSDYNDLYAPGAYVGYYGGDLTTLTNWQNATELDSNSISADPSFVSVVTPNLHINPPSPVEMAGIFIPEVTYDFDLDSRFIGQPDIGADEFVSGMSGTYDIGGGTMDFESIREAVQELNEGGMVGPVTFNVFTGLYHNQVDITSSISGLGAANPLVIQNAPGESPQMISTAGKGFQITNVDYVTIQGIEIYSCAYEGVSITGSPSDSCSNIRILNNYIHDVGTYYTGNYHGILLSYCVDCEIIGNEIEGDDYGLTSLSSRGNLFANNMIYSCLSTGLRSFMCNDDQYYYNSVYVDQGKGFEISGSSGLIIKNNSIFNDGSSFLLNYACFSLQNVSFPSITSDYNNLYAPDPLCYVGYNVSTSTSYSTLPQWQTATGWDANSIGVDPGYSSITMNIDLHITESSPLDRAATPIAGILVDLDGESRHSVYPDIGADEVGIVEPLEPVDDLVITLSSSTDITLIWSAISGAQQYHIYKSTTDPYSGFTLIDSIADTNYTDTNVLINELKSFYYVTADNEPLDAGLDRPSSRIKQNHRPSLPSTSRQISP